MKFTGKKLDGKLVFPAFIKEERRKYWERIKDGSEVEESLSVKRPSKTQSQLGAIWGLLMSQAVSELEDRGYDTSFIYNLPKPTGNAITKEDLCKYFYAACPIYSAGKIVTLSKANTIQASKFFEDVRNWMASQWSIVIPDPNPNFKKDNL